MPCFTILGESIFLLFECTWFILHFPFSNIAYMSAIGDGEITRDEFIENGLKSGFVMNLMEYFEDVPDPEPEKCGKPRCRNKCRCESSDGDQK